MNTDRVSDFAGPCDYRVVALRHPLYSLMGSDMKTRIWILIASHVATGIVAFAAGIYVLPILTASEGASAVELQVAADNARHTGRFERGLPGSDPLHWADGKLTITDSSIAFEGNIAPGPDYKIYLVPEFVDTRASFLAIKARAARVGELKTFGNFVVPLPADVNPAQYTSVVIWCERFSKFISAARYRNATASGQVSM
ncbi:hypothetical protein BLA6863_07872 [Burkholderia lata]|uniref:DM13 domain-containing protein n=2 Tax=Burkholderiaceae TaxID=119060 RepID=A0A6P2SRN1_BURL3|nr:hypothetical protein BLA6863_07872 [Burkholderia lata]